MNISLSRNDGFKWFRSSDVLFKGYFFCENGQLYNDQNACDFFSTLNDIKEFSSALSKLNGSFAVLVNREGFRAAAVDRLRSIPLFYRQAASILCVSDEIFEGQNEGPDARLSARSVDEFILSGFTIGDSTLLEAVYQIRPGEAIFEDSGKFVSCKYYNHIVKIKKIDSERIEFDRLDRITENWASRFVQSLQGRQLVIPLSGGYDSRYIAALVAGMGVANVIAYTYGVSTSPEVSRSKLVAQKLGIKWHFVEYTAEKYRDFLLSKEHEEYIQYSHFCSSTPHYQEFIALKELIAIGAIESTAVVAPGFCGDFLGGSYVPIEAKLGREDLLLRKGLLEHVTSTQLYLRAPFSEKVPTAVRQHIADELLSYGVELGMELNAQEVVQYNDAFFAQHKVAKYVVNSLRVYEYFKLEWRMPLWDSELMDYWYSVPYQFKRKAGLYDRFLEQRVFPRFDINIKKPGSGRMAKILEAFYRLPVSWQIIQATALSFRSILSFAMRKDATAFDVPRDHYLSDLKEQDFTFPAQSNFVSIFTRWIVSRRYDRAPFVKSS